MGEGSVEFCGSDQGSTEFPFRGGGLGLGFVGAAFEVLDIEAHSRFCIGVRFMLLSSTVIYYSIL